MTLALQAGLSIGKPAGIQASAVNPQVNPNPVSVEGNVESGGNAAAEIARLRNEVTVQARELAVVRWQIAALLKQRSAFRSVTMRLWSSVQHRFPRHAERLARLRRRVMKPQQPSAAPAVVPLTPISVTPGIKLPSPLLAIGEGVLDRFANIRNDEGTIRVTSGAGFSANLPVAPNNGPALRAAEAGSLAAWLIDDKNSLSEIKSVIIDEGDEISLALLRGRMTGAQVLGLVSGAGAKSALATELGKPDASENGLSVYSRFPDGWRDPLNADDADVAAGAWPKISVVMVSYNQAKYLEEGLRSVLDQGYPNLEVLVVDGNSTDESPAILGRYRDRLDYLLIEPDKGQADGLNKGFAKATGEVLTWVNSDDMLEPGALFRVAQAFKAHKVDMVVGGCRQTGQTRAEIIRNHHTTLPYALPVQLPLGLLLEMDRFWLTANFFYQPEVFFTRDIWKRSGGRLRTDLNYVLDYDLWVRMAAAGATIVHIPDFLACSRTHELQKTTVGMPYLPEVQRLLREYADRLIGSPA